MSAIGFILLYGVSYGLVLALISIGLVVTMGLMRVVNMAHGAFAGIGGYIAAAVMNNLGLHFLISAAVASLAVAALSVVVERLVFVHLYTAPELDQVLMTIGLDFIAIGGLTLIFGSDVYAMNLPPSLNATVNLGFRSFEIYRILVIVIAIAVIAALWLGFERTNFGASLRAAVDNQSMAAATGINVPRLFSATFALGSGLAAFGGAIGAPMLPLEPSYPFKYLVLVLIVVALAGFGNIRAVVGVAILVGVIETVARYLEPELGNFVLYFVLIGLLIWRRDGLFARRSQA